MMPVLRLPLAVATVLLLAACQSGLPAAPSSPYATPTPTPGPLPSAAPPTGSLAPPAWILGTWASSDGNYRFLFTPTDVLETAAGGSTTDYRSAFPGAVVSDQATADTYLVQIVQPLTGASTTSLQFVLNPSLNPLSQSLSFSQVEQDPGAPSGATRTTGPFQLTYQSGS